MLVPAAMTEFDEPHTRFREASSEEALTAEAIGRVGVDSIQRQRLFRFAGEVHHAGDGVLHAKRELEVFDVFRR